MKSRIRLGASAVRVSLAAAISASVLVVTLGAAAPSANALGTSKFCTTLFGYAASVEKYESETPTSLKSYHAWAKELLPYYEALEASAPNATTKTELGYIVTILQYYSNQSSFTKIEAYAAANRAKFEAGVKSLANAIKSCA